MRRPTTRAAPWAVALCLLAGAARVGAAGEDATVMVSPAPRLHAEVLGHSVAGRALRLIRVGDPQAPRRVLVVGCIHGDECAGLSVTRALRALAPPPGTQLLVLDTANPDGRARGTRANAHGVDLNRNFPWRWRPLDGVYASGPRPSSEPETRLLERLILRERPSVSIWFHQHMDLVDRTRGSDPQLLRLYARVAHMRLHRLALLPGTATRWTLHRLPGRTAFVVELPAGRMRRTAVRRHVAAVAAVVQISRQPA